MQQLTVSSRVLEFAPPCKQLSLIQIVLSILSFSLTWYRVWWDSVIALCAALWGYYALHDTNAQLNQKHVQYFNYGFIASMVSHVIALAVVLYYMLQGHLFNDIIGLKAIETETPGWVFFSFLIVILGIEIVLNAFTIWRSYSLLAEIARNSVLVDLTRGNARV